ncbi:MAG: hypothetical protein IJ417_04450 [Bacteroidaceae bacterium]|nr:hypothetical protein [Bacteroidaceae bacterium]
MSKLTIKDRNDLVISTIKPIPGEKKEYYVITHERPDIDETVRECYRKLVCKYLEEWIKNGKKKDEFLMGLYEKIRNKKATSFWGYEILGVTVYENLWQSDKPSFGSISWDGNTSIKLQGENSSINVKNEKETKSKPNNEDEKEDKNSGRISLEDGDDGTSTSQQTTGSFDFRKFFGNLKNEILKPEGKGRSILNYVLIGALAVIVYLVLTQLFTNLN